MHYLAAILLLFLLPPPGRGEVLALCNLRIESGQKISFTGTEEKWLCGDSSSPAWQSIPLSQQKLFLTGFLQERGYHRPRFREERGRWLVDAGPLFHVQIFSVHGAPPGFYPGRRRKLLGSALTPTALDQTSTWAKRQLQYIGYPCPQLSPKAFLDNEELRLDIKPGPAQAFGSVATQGASDLDPRILERFTAFLPDQPFDNRLLELSSSRLLQEDLYLSTFYDLACDPAQVASLTRRFVPAAPHLLTFGLGFDTERGPIARARMKRVRLSSKANSFEATTFLSFREQQIEFRFRDHFPADPASRVEFAPRLRVKRESELSYETVTAVFDPAFANSWEHHAFQLSARAGPLFERTDTHRGAGTRHVNSVRLAAQISAMSHLYEYYLGEPQSGWNLSLEASTQFSGVASRQSIQRALLHHEALWNIGHFDPPLFVLGWRGFAGTYFFRQEDFLPHDIPVNERYFLGGDEDIRGFGRKKLPGNGVGFLTVLYQGFELRLVETLPAKLQPFVFFDYARGGMGPHRLDSGFFWSPGMGLRWASPVGTLRASMARGYASRPDPVDPRPSWQLFVSFGKEF